MTGETRTELADARTELAEDRTLLANERTFAGWARTSFGAIGIGLGFNALFDRLEPLWLPKAISTCFLLIAIFVIIVAERRACAVKDRLNSHEVVTFKTVNLRLIMGAIVSATVALIAAIWMFV
ncbi:MAG: DUF202 domain-containing protein [Alphaproteobacteria bacterium]|nr:DUF202 domain-containing protein [Alphaproteobacteria bacterium]